MTIVIVNYNVREFLQQCLESIDRSDHSLSFEVIVVDNDSHDQSVSILGPKFPHVQFVALDENLGFGRANNIGLRRARGRYILLLNPDTLIQEDTIDTMVRYMDDHPDVGIGGCKVLNANGTFQVQCRRGFPSPWVSFCKLFGLQSLFPRSPLFARYNQTFRSEDETYRIDAVIGAFMFCRREPLLAIGGFDEDFFMYGEDLDLCYRMKQQGFATAYVPLTTIVHFKGESTRRSSINEVKWFYDAMEIFARKHYGTSFLFLMFLRTGIHLRSLIAYGVRYGRGALILALDMAAVIINLLVAVKLRRGDFFALPAYAFPTVFIVVPSVVSLSMMAVGEYFENRPTVRRAALGLLVSFFILSSLTYYWNEYAFSRGVLLMTIGFSLATSACIRGAAALFDTLFGTRSDRRLLLVGTADAAERTAEQLQRTNALSARVVGYAETGELHGTDDRSVVPLLGHRDYLAKLIDQYDIDEVVVIGDEVSTSENIRMMQTAVHLDVRFHFAR
ncbi:MAG: glycosyltransferase, partial [Candidatus Kapaibacterium sp.]